MPKEIVNNRWSDTFHRSHAMCPGVNCLPDCAGIDVAADRRYVAVGWGQHQDVQIGMVDPDQLVPPDADGHGVEEQIWMDLDRAGINALIRLLRKARDRAFGRDE